MRGNELLDDSVGVGKGATSFMAQAPNRAGQYRVPRAARPFIAVALGLVLLIAAWMTYRWYNGELWTAETVGPAPVLQVTAGELAAAYDQDAVQAHALYDGRTLQITGMMARISAGIGDPMITLGGADPLLTVTAALDEADAARLATMPTNRPITVTCRSVMLVVDEPALADCTLGGGATATTE